MTRRMASVATLALLFALSGGCASSVVSDSPAGEGLGAIMPSVVKPPKPQFTRTMFATATIKTVDKQLDKCSGPVSVPLGTAWPILVVEHDFCGGSAWISRLHRGDAVDLSGPGVAPDIYVVEEIKTVKRGSAKVRELPPTDLVLQTCISATEMVLVGLQRFSPVQDG